MDAIKPGLIGAAVEDVQQRLINLGASISDDERIAQAFGPTTAAAVRSFRAQHGLPMSDEIDEVAWIVLVDETYHMGDRTLYLRLPYFHGADVSHLQMTLNVLGFSCGTVDGFYGPHTEAAVKEFQANMGLTADGMAFQDTFDAIERLHHVWAGKPASGPHPLGAMGFARAASVLESVKLSITAEDPISRNVAGRIVNLASATNDRSGLDIVESPHAHRPGDQGVLVIASGPLPQDSSVPNVIMDDIDTLPMRLRTAIESSDETVPVVRVQLPLDAATYNGTFTISDAQTFAVMLLDAICAAFEA